MTDIEKWNADVTHPLQSWEWGEFRKENGNKISRVIGEHPYQIIWSRIPHTKYYFGYCGKSHIPTSSDLVLLKKESQKMNGVGIRFEPNATSGTIPPQLKPGRHFFTTNTFYLDISKSEEDLLKAMHPKARYNIRLAQKRGVVVKEDNSQIAFERYLELTFKETSQRQKFYAHNYDYHIRMWNHMSKDIGHLFTATYEDKILVTWILFKFKNMIYFPYGASSSDQRDVQAPSLMLWETAKWGKESGAKTYDLWGAEEGKGFNRFKEQFSPNLVTFVGTYDLPVNTFLYSLFRLSETLRWKILRLLK